MNKILLIEPENKKNIQILREFFQNLSPILNIKGFCIEEKENKQLLQINLLSQKSVSFSLHLNQELEETKKVLESFLDALIYELSVFELVDIFLLDKLGILETFSPRLQQQIITIFSSRIPVIGMAHQRDVPKLNYLLAHKPIKVLDLSEFDEHDMFSNLIRELYDL